MEDNVVRILSFGCFKVHILPYSEVGVHNFGSLEFLLYWVAGSLMITIFKYAVLRLGLLDSLRE